MRFIRRLLSKALKKELPGLLKDIDAEIVKNLPPMSLKNLIAKDWNKLVKPVKAGDLWVSFNPSEVLFRGFHTNVKGDDLRLGLGAKGLINVSLTEPQSKNIPIPPIKQISTTDPILNAYIPLHSAFDDIEKIANKELAGKKFETEDYFLEIKEIGFNGVMVNNKSKVLIDIDFKGGRDTHWYDFFTDRVDGHLYFLATPEYDSAKRVLYISDLELTSETSSSLIDLGLNWMFKLKKDILLKELKVDVGQHIDKVDEAAKTLLSQGLSFGNFKVKGSFEELTFDGFYMDNNEMELYFKLIAALETQYVEQAPQSK